MMTRGTIRSVVILSAIAVCAVPPLSESAAQGAAAEVAFVEEVKGQVVAVSHGRAIPLEKFVIIRDRTRLELPPESELRICHYGLNRLLTLSGPLQAVVAREGVSGENLQITQAAVKCTPPVKSKNTGGLMMRGKPKSPPPE
jgi:hypothetical protein